MLAYFVFGCAWPYSSNSIKLLSYPTDTINHCYSSAYVKQQVKLGPRSCRSPPIAFHRAYSTKAPTCVNSMQKLMFSNSYSIHRVK